MELDWATPEGERSVVLAADVIYDPEIVPLLVGAIEARVEEYALVAATVRNEETFALFLETCKTRGLGVEVLQLEPMDPDTPTFWDTALDRGTRVEIIRVTPNANA